MRTHDTLRRDLFRGSTPLLILALLADGPLHGYAIQQHLQQSLNQTLAPASLYPLLNQLETQGHLAATKTTHLGRPRKTYRLTEQGQQHLRRLATHWQATVAQLQSVVLPAVRRVASKPPAKTN